MTKLSVRSSVTRESLVVYRGRPLIVELSAHYVAVRQKGRRDRVPVPIQAVYDLGMKLRAREARELSPLGTGRRRR